MAFYCGTPFGAGAGKHSHAICESTAACGIIVAYVGAVVLVHGAVLREPMHPLRRIDHSRPFATERASPLEFYISTVKHGRVHTRT